MDWEYEIEYEKDGEYEYLTVTFQAEPRWENDGIGAYEYWGAKGYDRGHDYVSLEYYGDPTWNESDYTEDENRIINEFRSDSKKWGKLCEYICEKYAEGAMIDD